MTILDIVFFAAGAIILGGFGYLVWKKITGKSTRKVETEEV